MSKTIDQMNSLSDMGKFPVSVHLGASLNLLFTAWLTHLVFGKVEGSVLYLLPFAVLMLVLNVLPVIVLRKVDKGNRDYPIIQQMGFFGNQHRFATWVYAVACGNMFFWITFSWCVFSYSSSLTALILVQAFVFIVTFVPLWRRFL